MGNLHAATLSWWKKPGSATDFRGCQYFFVIRCSSPQGKTWIATRVLLEAVSAGAGQPGAHLVFCPSERQ